MNIILIGIQGSGKGTQARLIQEKYSYNFFEMGQKLRNFIELGLPESQQVKEYVSRGSLVPLELIGKILTHYRDTHKDNFTLFDGIPRSPDQKELFDLIIDEYVVFFLDLNKEEAIRRLSGRRIDPTTGESFGPEFMGDTNPATGAKLITRADDTPEAVKKRIEIFYSNTLPLLAAWAHDGKKIYKIDASGTIDNVFSKIEEIIGDSFYSSIDFNGQKDTIKYKLGV